MRGPEGGKPCKRFVKAGLTTARWVGARTESQWEGELESALFDKLMGLFWREGKVRA